MARLDGKVAVVVGCATGIGARTARMIAAEGARVVLGDVLAEGAERAASDIRAAGGSAAATRVDISSDADVAALFELAESTYGGCDVLANIAADTRIYMEDAKTDAAQVSMAVWDRTLDVNLKGFVRTIRHAIPQMLRKGGGAIVNISSIGSLQPDTWAGAYSASKAAVNALTMHIASAYGKRGIRCNAIAPRSNPHAGKPAGNRVCRHVASLRETHADSAPGDTRRHCSRAYFSGVQRRRVREWADSAGGRRCVYPYTVVGGSVLRYRGSIAQGFHGRPRIDRFGPRSEC